ncbi:MAG TPA: serine hydrolase domain-containing protein [Blastocatellia bacterium]|nr:serine hydrolase domain-containing protein [Blastocatellia bacterium]
MRNSLFKKCFVILAALLFMSSSLSGRHSTAVYQQKIDFGELESTILNELEEKKTPGAALAIVSGDRVLYAEGFGTANVESPSPVTPDMLFRLGSTTKMFTGAALVTLAEDGRIKLDAPIANYIQGLDPHIARLTPHNLLSNTAGMRDFAAPFISHDDSALSEMVRSWKQEIFFTEPGRIYSYSSAGFWLAGFVIEEIGKKPYADMMDELLFKPLGMKRTTFRPLVAMTYTLATGHAPGEGGAPSVIRPAFNNVAMWPAGSIYSSANDLSRFVIAMMNGGRLEGAQALRASVVSKLPAPHVTMPGDPDAGYGYGLLTFNHRGVRMNMHGGFSRGYGSMIQMVPEHKVAVIVVTNKSGETLPKTREKALEMLLPLKPATDRAAAAEMPVGEKEMEKYIGLYSHAPQVWEIFAKQGKLFIKQEGVESPLIKTGNFRFRYGSAGENEIVLVPGADGNAEFLFTGLYSAARVPAPK